MNSVYPPNRFSVAPMLNWTDRHCRYFYRILTKKAFLYTEMVTTGAVLRGKGDYLLFNEEEHPLSLQLGGADPHALARCAIIAQQRGYDEVNLNVGCPSNRVQNGKFGACLMAMPERVADCVDAMQSKINIPVTVKTRLGIDKKESYDFLCQFIETVMPYSQTFIIHARKAWLSGLSPKKNRDVPPLNYDKVYRLKRDYPSLIIVINGGIKTWQEAKRHLQHVDGVMIGREACQNPMLLAQADQQIFSDTRPIIDAKEAIYALFPYIEKSLLQGVRLNHIMRHTLGVFNGRKGAKLWRHYLGKHAYETGADLAVVEKSLAFVD